MRSSTSSSDAHYPKVHFRTAWSGIALAVVLFCTAWFLGDRFLALSCQRVLLDSQLRFSRIYDGSNTADVLFFGDSRAVNTFYTPALDVACGTRSLNLGYNGCSTAIAVALFEDYLELNKAPKTVVLELNCVGQGDELLKSLKMYGSVSKRLAALLRETWPRVERATAVTRLYSYNCELFPRALYYMYQDDQSWVKRYSINPALLERLKVEASTPLYLAPATERNLAAVARMAETCRERNIRFVAVIAPFLRGHLRRLANFDEWREAVEKRTGVNAVDMSAAVPDDSHFADTLHINKAGAEAIVPLIREIIVGSD